MPAEIEAEESELSEAEDEETEAEELEEESEERREEASAEVREAMTKLSGEGKNIRISIEILTQNFPEAQRALKPERATDPEEYAEDEETGKERKKKNTKAVEDTLKEATGEEEGGGEEESEKKKTSNLNKFVIFFAGVYALGPELQALFESLTRLGKGESISDLIKGAAMQAQLVALANAWKAETDEKYWADFASFVERQKATIAEIVYFMQYTMLFSALDKADPFRWHSWSDEADKVDELVKLYTGSEVANAKGDLIEELPKIKYDDEVVPRYIQASLGQQAFSRALRESKAQKPAEEDSEKDT